MRTAFNEMIVRLNHHPKKKHVSRGIIHLWRGVGDQLLTSGVICHVSWEINAPVLRGVIRLWRTGKC